MFCPLLFFGGLCKDLVLTFQPFGKICQGRQLGLGFFLGGGFLPSSNPNLKEKVELYYFFAMGNFNQKHKENLNNPPYIHHHLLLKKKKVYCRGPSRGPNLGGRQAVAGPRGGAGGRREGLRGPGGGRARRTWGLFWAVGGCGRVRATAAFAGRRHNAASSRLPAKRRARGAAAATCPIPAPRGADAQRARWQSAAAHPPPCAPAALRPSQPGTALRLGGAELGEARPDPSCRRTR